MHTVFALLCFVVIIHWLIFPYPSGLLHWPCGNLTIAPVPAKQPWWIWINTSCEFIMNDCITTTKQNTTKPCAYFLGYTVAPLQQNMNCIYFSQQSNAAAKKCWHFCLSLCLPIYIYIYIYIGEIFDNTEKHGLPHTAWISTNTWCGNVRSGLLHEIKSSLNKTGLFHIHPLWSSDATCRHWCGST